MDDRDASFHLSIYSFFFYLSFVFYDYEMPWQDADIFYPVVFFPVCFFNACNEWNDKRHFSCKDCMKKWQKKYAYVMLLSCTVA